MAWLNLGETDETDERRRSHGIGEGEERLSEYSKGDIGFGV